MADRAGWVYAAIKARVLQSLTAGSRETGVEFLADALKRAQPEKCIRTFVDTGDALIPLLQEAARQGIYLEYISQILSVMGKQTLREFKMPALGGWLEVKSLSERELEVLRLVAVGLSNREIAKTLYLSPGTVKTHIHHIFGKLGVENRTQAVTRAKELELV
jgi:LuxR family maltose regulon positive regulatory protein